MSIAEALKQIADFERIEDTALNHRDVMTAVHAKLDLLEYLRDREPLVWMAYQQSMKPMALGATAAS